MRSIIDPELGKIEIPGALTSPKEQERIYAQIKAKIDALQAAESVKSLMIEEPEAQYEDELKSTKEKAEKLSEENDKLKGDINAIILELIKGEKKAKQEEKTE